VALVLTTVESYPFSVYHSPRYGKSGGYYFNDYLRNGLGSSSVVGIDKIYIHYVSYDVLAIQMSYRESSGTCRLGYYHGDGTRYGGANSIISLSTEEYVSRISGRYEKTIRYLYIEIKNSRTGSTRSYSYGPNRGQHFTISGPIYGIHGCSGSRIDNLGVLLSKPSYGPVGYTAGTGFWDPVLTAKPAISRLYKVCIRYGSDVDAIQSTYLTVSGTYYTTGRYGGSGGGESCFTLSTNERIASVQIHKINNHELPRIKALKFTISVTNSHSQYTRGPYGKQEGASITLHTTDGVLGFFGHYSSVRLTALGVVGN
jgi:hypothetical protein